MKKELKKRLFANRTWHKIKPKLKDINNLKKFVAWKIQLAIERS